MFDNTAFTYISVKGDGLKDTNDNTRKLWQEAIGRDYDEVIDITKEGDKEKDYLVEPTLYHNLLQASREGDGTDPYGIPNVNFSLIQRTDHRWGEYKKQRLAHGFDLSELWSLDSTISRFIEPRLKAYRVWHGESHPAYIVSLEEWDAILDKMILAFEYINDESLGEEDGLSPKEIMGARDKVINEGLDLFREHFFSLWW